MNKSSTQEKSLQGLHYFLLTYFTVRSIVPRETVTCIVGYEVITGRSIPTRVTFTWINLCIKTSFMTKIV